MSEKLTYVTDSFLKNFKEEFGTKYSPLYQNRDKQAITDIFSDPEVIRKSEIDFHPVELRLLPEEGENDNTWKIDYENAVSLWESLRITPSIALNEKMWIALENTYFLDYTLDQLKTVQDSTKPDARIIFTYNAKRSVTINSLSLLWWSVYYTIDEECKSDPYHLTRFFFEYVRRSTKMAWLSSNVISSKNVALGILEGIQELVISGKIKGGRYAFTNSNKLINQVGGVRLLDILEREEIKRMVIDNLLGMDKTELNNN
ncbi:MULTISPECIES: DUF6339 family protein [Enterococcus]|uniref:DUF6339 family protein n=1 Tax=Enterococcus TaxID=1350 RepID=UPI001C8BED7B|nr:MULTISPECIES: DUF6339 family protein [Enterococcus]